MRSFAFFFNGDTFEANRRRLQAGQTVPIDHVGAADRLPFKTFAAGDELFIVGLRDFRVLLAGRLIVAGRPITRDEARSRTGRHDFIDKPLICLANTTQLDAFRSDLTVPDEIAQALELFGAAGKAVEVESLKAGRPDPNLFRACPQLSEASAASLRAVLGLRQSGGGEQADVESSDASEGADDDEYRQRAIKTRRGQSRFRRNLLEAYGGKCQITKCRVEELLEAAHITPHAELTDYRVSNGLLLRTDIHTLFDLDLITVDEAYRVHVSPQLRYSEYWCYEGRQLDRFPDKMADQPDREALKLRAARLKRDAASG